MKCEKDAVKVTMNGWNNNKMKNVIVQRICREKEKEMFGCLDTIAIQSLIACALSISFCSRYFSSYFLLSSRLVSLNCKLVRCDTVAPKNK